MKVAGPRAVADLVLLAVPELRERLVEQRIRQSWTRLVGPDVARRAHPRALTGGCLQVVVDNSPWLHELTLRAPELTARLGAEFAEIRTLRLALGALPARPAEPPAVPAAPPEALDGAELDEIDQATAPIRDPALAFAARRLLTRAWRSSRPRGGAA